MKTINIELSREFENLKLVTVADYHCGSAQCQMSLIEDELKYIKNNENVYAIVNGDLLENATRNSLGDVYTQKISPMKQINKIVEMLKPIKDKILCLTSGNHENRSYITEGIDLMQIVAQELGLSDKYSNGSCLLFLRFGTMSNGCKESKNKSKIRMVCYTVYVTHGSGGGGKIGSKSNRAAELQNIIDADIYIISHMHAPNAFKEGYYRVDTRNSAVAFVDKLFVISGAKLDWNNSYAEKKSLKPSSLVNPIITLEGKRKWFTASL